MKETVITVGDYIIDSDLIYVISKIEDDRLYYQPYNHTGPGSGCSGSIPRNNLTLAGIRPLLSKSEVSHLMDQLSSATPLELPPVTNIRNTNANFLKEVLYHNDPLKTGRLLIALSQNQKDIPLSSSDLSTFNQALSHLADEIALVDGISPSAAQAQILSAINR